ncbi:MAG: hypothetical protein ACJAXK_000588 [Yoonia sp.]|jgi:hypothetical protein
MFKVDRRMMENAGLQLANVARDLFLDGNFAGAHAVHSGGCDDDTCASKASFHGSGFEYDL